MRFAKPQEPIRSDPRGGKQDRQNLFQRRIRIGRFQGRHRESRTVTGDDHVAARTLTARGGRP